MTLTTILYYLEGLSSQARLDESDVCPGVVSVVRVADLLQVSGSVRTREQPYTYP